MLSWRWSSDVRPAPAAALSLVTAAALGVGVLVGTQSPAPAPAYPVGALPDPRLTPGEVLPNVTAAQVSAPGYAHFVRDVPQSEKNAVYAEYGVKNRKPGEYEIDHLVSLELGGSNSVRNLFPEPYNLNWNGRDAGAHSKDRLEDRLASELRSGKLTLQQAQAEIRTDWIQAYRKHIGELPAYPFQRGGSPAQP